MSLFFLGCANTPPVNLVNGTQVLEFGDGVTFHLDPQRYNVTEKGSYYRVWDRENHTLLMLCKKGGEGAAAGALTAPWGYTILSKEVMATPAKDITLTKQNIKLSGGCHRQMVRAVGPGFSVLQYSGDKSSTSGKGVEDIILHLVIKEGAVAVVQ